MKDKTKAEYLSIANHFIKSRLAGDATPRVLVNALTSCASEYRPAYWRRLRKALETHQRHYGFYRSADRILSTKNPVTRDGDYTLVKPKQRRVKTVTDHDHLRLKIYLHDRGDELTLAAVRLCMTLGCRPAELPTLIFEDGVVIVRGVKKRHDRGLDRLLHVKPHLHAQVADDIALLHNQTIKIVQDRLRRACVKIWPQRKSHISLYSYRHRMGDSLKKWCSETGSIDDTRRAVAAYCMGHRATASIDKYGNRAATTGVFIRPAIPTSQIKSIVTINHEKGYSRQAIDHSLVKSDLTL